MKLLGAFAALLVGTAAQDTCSVADYNNDRVASWRTNCPSGCELYEYLEQTDDMLK